MKRQIGPQEVGEDLPSKIARLATEATGPVYQYQGPKPTPAQEASFQQAAAAYASYADSARQQAQAAREVAGYYMRMTRTGMRAITMQITGGPTEKPEQAEPEHAPQDVKVLLPASGFESEMDIVWTTPDKNEEAKTEGYYGTAANELGEYVTGDVKEGENIGDPRIHSLTLKNLVPGTQYFIKVGDSKYGFTKIFKFKTKGDTPEGLPEDDPDEKRIDPADGRAYTKQEFLKAYHCLIQWHKAAPVAKEEHFLPSDGQTFVIIRGFAPRPPPTGIAAFFAQRLRSRHKELGKEAELKEMSRGPNEVRIRPIGGLEPAKLLTELINVQKDYNKQLFPGLEAELLVHHGQTADGVHALTMGENGADGERRFDPACTLGKLYSKAEFAQTYGSDDEWNKAPKAGEMRIDPADGGEYTWPEFRSQYRGRNQWDAARKPGEPLPPLVRMKGFGREPPKGTCAFFAKRLLNFRAGVLSALSQVEELEASEGEELLIDLGSETAAKAMVEMINEARDFNTEHFPNLTAALEQRQETSSKGKGEEEQAQAQDGTAAKTDENVELLN